MSNQELRTKDHQLSREVFESLHSDLVAGSYRNRVAHPGYVFKCRACGKRSKDRYGDDPIDEGFDESCMLRCVLVEA
jgi:hypothetical protein